MYTGNLSGIFQMLNGTGQNWMVQIELPETENIGAGELWQAQLHFIAGKVVTCSVRSSADGRTLLAGKEAIRWLERAQHLAWKLEVLTPRQVSLPVPVSPPSVVPHRV